MGFSESNDSKNKSRLKLPIKFSNFAETHFTMSETQVQEETFTLDEILSSIKRNHRLILWNDDTNTFDHVINCLVKYLDYTESQAEKIAWTVHTKGKCAVLEGSWTEVEVYRKILKQEGLTVTIE